MYIAVRACRELFWPHWHDDVAYTMVYIYICLWQCVIFRNEVGSYQRARVVNDKHLLVNNASDWLPAREARIELGTISSGVLERSLRLTETAGYSAWTLTSHGLFINLQWQLLSSSLHGVVTVVGFLPPGMESTTGYTVHLSGIFCLPW
jgi:hypothetical protein